VKLIDRHLRGRSDLQPRLIPDLHSAAKIARDTLNADARKPHHCLIDRGQVFGNQNDWCADSNQHAAPGGKLTAQGDVHRSGHVCIPKRSRRSNIEKDMTLF